MSLVFEFAQQASEVRRLSRRFLDVAGDDKDLADRDIQIMAAFTNGPDPGQSGLICQLPCQFGKVLPVQPDLVHPGPCLTAGIQDALTQQEFGEPLPGKPQKGKPAPLRTGKQ
ncbi:hypothetical protein [Arthrobacter sp. ZGTC212]|uniref:hypothetical protein n=1 Tax=Arthrobacter sp. ZGTC212 TaxID=2058899 RepID=UPI0015E1DEEE|nr:hypothetical protein [Arthrobacter sp. ZGTC212]